MEASLARHASPAPRTGQDGFVTRLDPAGCECPDCQLGYARPLDQASTPVLYAALLGTIVNNSDEQLKLLVIPERERPERKAADVDVCARAHFEVTKCAVSELADAEWDRLPDSDGEHPSARSK